MPAPKHPPSADIGNIRLTVEGPVCVVHHRAAPQLEIRIPVARVEAWFLRRLRDETLQPATRLEAA